MIGEIMVDEKKRTPILQLDQLTGGYSLQRAILHDISFTVHSGEMVALIGRNGAGKSTTMKHILGLLKPHQGSVKIKGKMLEENPHAYRTAYTYVPENPVLYDELNVMEHLELSARAYGISEADYKTRSAALLERFEMEKAKHKIPLHLSKGMRQKVMIMCAFLVKPEFYVIDEPFLGLDPLGIRSLLDLMVEEKQRGAGLLISSHILSMIEKYTDRYIILDNGTIRMNGTLADWRKQTNEPDAAIEDLFYQMVTTEEPL